MGTRPTQLLAELTKTPLAIEAVRRIDAIFDVERTINGLPIEQRCTVQQEQIAALVDDLQNWMRGVRSKMIAAIADTASGHQSIFISGQRRGVTATIRGS